MSQPETIWYTRCPVPTTSGIAQHFRWLHNAFARIGIEVESIRASADKSVRRSHYDHSQPNQFREGGNVPPLWARGLGRDTVVVGITWVDEEQLILVRADSDIRNVTDLKGKRLGLPRHDSEIVDIGRGQDLRGLLAALAIGQIDRAEVTFVDLDGGDFDLDERREGKRPHLGAEALLAGKADAIYAKGAVSATLIERHGFRAILDINAQEDPLRRVNAGTPRPVTVDGSLAREHPEIVARYLAVLQKTAEWAKDHPEEVVRALAAETGATEAAVRRGFGPHLHERFAVTLSPLNLQGLRQQKEFLVAEGFIQDFDFDAWIDPAPLALAETLASEIVLEADTSLEAAE
jgi:sulfonate transport system substrate-binding protein